MMELHRKVKMPTLPTMCSLRSAVDCFVSLLRYARNDAYSPQRCLLRLRKPPVLAGGFDKLNPADLGIGCEGLSESSDAGLRTTRRGRPSRGSVSCIRVSGFEELNAASSNAMSDSTISNRGRN